MHVYQAYIFLKIYFVHVNDCRLIASKHEAAKCMQHIPV